MTIRMFPDQTQMKKTKRNFWLIFLTTLSFIGGLTGIIVYLTAIFSFESLTIFNIIPGFTSVKSAVYDSHFLYPYIKVILLMGSVLGVFWMFNLKKKGFVLYSIAQILMLIVALVLSNNKLFMAFLDETPNIIFTIAFIASYSFFLKDFKKAENTKSETTED